jgi:hypothetical protein
VSQNKTEADTSRRKKKKEMIMNELKEYKEQFMAADDLAGEREVLKGLLTDMGIKFDIRPDGTIAAKPAKKTNEVFEFFKKWREEKIAPIIAEQKARYMAGVSEEELRQIRKHLNAVSGNKAYNIMYYWESEKKAAEKAKVEEARRAALTEEERQAEDFDKQILGVGVAKNGKPYIKMPATLKAGDTVQYKGVIFKTAGAGKVYQPGEIEIYNLYIEEEGWTATASGDYKFWNRKAVEEVGDYSRSFSRAMDDEGCVNYPSSTSLWAKVAESLKDQYIASDRQIKVYLSSCGWGDYSPVEWTGSSKTPKDTFLAEARRLLSGGDADNPNQTDEELLIKFAKAANKV